MAYCDNKTIKQNDCDLLALTYDGEIIAYTKSDKELNNWLGLGKGHDWFCVEL